LNEFIPSHMKLWCYVTFMFNSPWPCFSATVLPTLWGSRKWRGLKGQTAKLEGLRGVDSCGRDVPLPSDKGFGQHCKLQQFKGLQSRSWCRFSSYYMYFSEIFVGSQP